MAFLYEIYRNKWLPLDDPKDSFVGKNVIISGSNVGLGFEAASKFAHLGASRVILAVRSLEKGESAKATIDGRLANSATKSDCKVEVWQLDMNSYDSVRSFSKRVEEELDRLDIAMLNAGVMKGAYEQSQYGWEETLQVNVLSTVLIALLLLPKLKETRDKCGEIPVLEIVGSGLHKNVKLSEEERASQNFLELFNQKDKFAMQRQYAVSKLFGMCALAELSNMSSSSKNGNDEPDVLCVAVGPGMVRTELARDYQGSWAFTIGGAIGNALVFRTAEEGARSLVKATTLGSEAHGRFWRENQVQPQALLLVGEDGERLQRQVWKEILSALKKDNPDVLQSIN